MFNPKSFYLPQGNINMLKRNLFLYYGILSFNNFWFVTTNWVNYWLKFMSLPDVGLIDSLAFFIGILIEIPSGFISDKLGRKFSLLIANLFQFMGTFLITIGDHKYEIAVGFIIFQIGVALFSGSIEALGYEACDSEEEYEKVVQVSVFWSNLCYLGGLLAGGFLYTLQPEIANFLWSLNYLISMILAIFVIDNPFPQKNTEANLDKEFEVDSFLKFDLNTGLLLLGLSSISFIFDYGFLKISVMDKFSTIQDNYLYLFVITIVLMFINYFQTKFFPTKDYKILVFLVILSIFFLLLPFLSSLSVFTTFVFLTYLTIYLPQISLIYINTKVADERRATAISIFSFLWKAPYVVFAPFLAYSLHFKGLEFSLLILLFLVPFFLVFGHIFRKLYYNYVVKSGA